MLGDRGHGGKRQVASTHGVLTTPFLIFARRRLRMGCLSMPAAQPVAYQAAAREPEPYVEGRLGGQALGPKLEGQT